MSKHTPGPWRTGWLESYNATTGEPEAFVYRLPPDHPEETAHNRICIRGSESMDCDADARLIVAAPDMLQALQELVAEADHPVGWRGHPQSETTGFVLARAAIAKATKEAK